MNSITITNAPKHNLGKQAGVTLIELMIASVIGLVILAGAVTIFSSNNSSSSMSSGMARLQDSGRVALDILSNSIRMAGYQGCKSDSKNPPVVLATIAPDIDLPGTAIWGSQFSSSGWAPARLPKLAKASPREDTDILYIQHGSGRTTTLAAAMTSNTDSLQLATNPDRLAAGDLVMVSDCQDADIFRATTVTNNDSTGVATIAHATSANSQGSLNTVFTDTGGPASSALRVMRFEATGYFIGDSDRETPGGDTIFSLFGLDTTDPDLEPTPTELIEGVENMQILYGERLPVSGNVRYVVANDVDDMENVVSVQIGILIATANYAASSNDTNTYNIAGTSIGPPGSAGITHAGDRRLRAAFNTTVQLRNRNPNVL